MAPSGCSSSGQSATAVPAVPRFETASKRASRQYHSEPFANKRHSSTSRESPKPKAKRVSRKADGEVTRQKATKVASKKKVSKSEASKPKTTAKPKSKAVKPKTKVEPESKASKPKAKAPKAQGDPRGQKRGRPAADDDDQVPASKKPRSGDSKTTPAASKVAGKRPRDDSEDGEGDECPAAKKQCASAPDSTSLPEPQESPGRAVGAQHKSPGDGSARKRKFEDVSATEDPDDTKSSTQPEPPTKKQKSSDLKGVPRFVNSCHLGVTVQLLDEILSGVDLSGLLGELPDLESGEILKKDFRRYDVLDGLSKPFRNKKEAPLVARLREARDGPSGPVSVASYLRAILTELREGTGQDSRALAMYMFKQVFSYSGKSLESNNGDAQQCCWETFSTLIEALLEDKHLADQATLSKLVTVQAKEEDTCSAEGCGIVRQVDNTARGIQTDIVPVKSTAPVKLATLIEGRLRSHETGGDCSCGAAQRGKFSIRELPANLVVFISRALGGHKSMTPVEVPKPEEEVILEGSAYRLAAVVRHHGPSPYGGHYDIVRQQQDGEWYELDDVTKSRAKLDAFCGKKPHGQVVMILLKKVEGAATEA